MDLNQHQFRSLRIEFKNIFLNNFCRQSHKWHSNTCFSSAPVMSLFFKEFCASNFIVKLLQIKQMSFASLQIPFACGKCDNITDKSLSLTLHHQQQIFIQLFSCNWFLSPFMLWEVSTRDFTPTKHFFNSAIIVYSYLMILSNDKLTVINAIPGNCNTLLIANKEHLWENVFKLQLKSRNEKNLPQSSPPTLFFSVDRIQYLFSFGLAL